VPISLTFLLIVTGIVLLAFGIGSTAGAIRFLSGGASLIVAIASTAATIFLFWLGQKAHWTSDGPGALFIMIALVVCAIVAVTAWMFAFGTATAVTTPVDNLPDAPRDVKRTLRLLGVALLGAAALGNAVAAYLNRPRAAHAAAVAGVSFAASAPRLVTVDAAGTLVAWDLRTRRETRRRTRPELAGVTEFFVDSNAGRALAIAGGRALLFEPFGDAPAQTMESARHIARSGHVVVAKARSLIFASYSDWANPSRELPWPDEIQAIAASDEFVAVADRVSITILDGRINSTRTLATSPAPGAIAGLEILQDMTVLALDGTGAGWVVDQRRGVTESSPAAASLAASGRHMFLVSGRDVSEYDPRKKTAALLATVGAAVRSIDTRAEHVAFGLEDGEVVLGTRMGTRLETVRLTAKPEKR
jgi:hypothetical protein